MISKNTKKAVLFIIGFSLFTILMLTVALMLNLLSNKFEIKRRGSSVEEATAGVSNAPVYLIDAGHGGIDGGAVGYSGALEKDLNLALSLKLGALLDAVGCNVQYTRVDDTMLDYTEGSTPKVRDIRKRVAMANESGGMLISIHMNTYPAQKYSGLQVFYADNSTGSDIIADKIQNYVRANLQSDNSRKAKSAPNTVYLTNNIICPGVIIECGFISNPDEEALLKSEDYRCILAEVICCSLIG